MVLDLGLLTHFLALGTPFSADEPLGSCSPQNLNSHKHDSGFTNSIHDT